MADQSQRIEQIIERARHSFIADTTDKMSQLHDIIRHWKDTAIVQGEQIETIHRYVHSIKGLALTFHYAQIHHVCEQTLAYILQQENRPWTVSERNSLSELVEQLNDAVKRSFESPLMPPLSIYREE